MCAVTRRHLLVITAVLLCSLGGCATPPPAGDPDAVADFNETNDPLEPTNRVIYAFNDGLDTVIMRPAAQAYRFVIPSPVRGGVHNVLSNLGAPVQLGNDMLEGKPRRAGDTTMRFLINTTVGVLGIFDVAKDWGYPDHDADFGITLALWGLPSGPFLFLPVFGPSDPRDAIGLGVNVAMDPFTWVGQGTAVRALDWSRVGMNGARPAGASPGRSRQHQEDGAGPVCDFPQPVPPAPAGEDRRCPQRQAGYHSGMVSAIAGRRLQ